MIVCTLFAIVVVTCLLFDGDPKTVVFGTLSTLYGNKLDSTISNMEHSTASGQNQQTMMLSGILYIYIEFQIPLEIK